MHRRPIMSPLSFFSTIQISDRIEAFREAEKHLFEFAKTRFAHHNEHNADNHHFELFDTPIKIPSVIKDKAVKCQVHHDTSKHNSSNDATKGGAYSLHGVKVINKRLSSLQDDNESPPQSQKKKQPAPLVLLHGYANGSLYFYRNLMGLSSYFGSIYALDMLGWGMSSRPKFDLLTKEIIEKQDEKTICQKMSFGSNNHDNKEKQKVSSAESFFVESLESWRQAHNLPKMTLAGHSMGGYLSVAYAEKYPQHVEKLILLSPVGVPEKQPEDETRIKSLPFYFRAMVKTSRYLFEKGITPGAFLRGLPFSKSKAMVDGYILNRLPAIDCPEERKHLSEYLYQNSMLPGSGECCLSDILNAGAFAKIPLVDRIPNIKSAGNDSQCGDNGGLEVHMIYGQNDWMSYQGGLSAQQLCHEKRVEWEQQKENKSIPPPKVFVHGVKDASHLLMLDNYEEFNAAMIIASGGEADLPSSMPRPVEFVCDEVAAAVMSDSAMYIPRSNNAILGEEDAVAFFRGPRWNRGQQKAEEGNVQEDSNFEEKKVEEQQLA